MAYPHTQSVTSPASATTIISRPINDETTSVVMCTPVYADGPGTFKKAIGDGTAHAKFFGVVADQLIAAGQLGAVLSVGVLTAATTQWDAVCGTSGGLTYGTLYYLSTTIAGALTTSSASNVPVIFGLGPTVGAIVTGGGSGGITNSAGAGVFMLSDGVNAVTSPVSYDGNTVLISQATSSANGAFRITSQTPGLTKQVFLQQTDANHTAFEAINVVAFQQATFDTTAAPAFAVAVDAETISSRVAGANQLQSIGLLCAATNGDQNFAVSCTAGLIKCNDGATLGPTLATGFCLSGTAATGVCNLTSSSASSLINFSSTSSSIQAGQITSLSTFAANTNAFFKGEMRLDSGAVDFYMYPTTALSSSAQRNIYLSAGGTNGVVRINANTGGITNTGTGGLEVWPGANGGSAVGGISGAGMVYGQASASATESLSASGAASVALGQTFASGAATNLTLANGTKDGQLKTVTATSGTGQVTPAAFGNGTKMTWSAAGQSSTFVWGATSAKWWLVANVGMTVV